MKNFYDQIIALKKGTKIDFNYKIIEENLEKDINKNLVKEISKLSTRKITAQRDSLLKLLSEIYESKVVKEDGIITIKDEEREKIEKLTPIEPKSASYFYCSKLYF